MKILAIEKEIENVNWSDAESILKQEAYYVNDLCLQNILREIYFTEDKRAVLILECQDIKHAKKIIDSLPLVKDKMIEFDIVSLLPYTGLSRIIEDK